MLQNGWSKVEDPNDPDPYAISQPNGGELGYGSSPLDGWVVITKDNISNVITKVIDDAIQLGEKTNPMPLESVSLILDTFFRSK